MMTNESIIVKNGKALKDLLQRLGADLQNTVRDPSPLDVAWETLKDDDLVKIGSINIQSSQHSARDEPHEFSVWIAAWIVKPWQTYEGDCLSWTDGFIGSAELFVKPENIDVVTDELTRRALLNA